MFKNYKPADPDESMLLSRYQSSLFDLFSWSINQESFKKSFKRVLMRHNLYTINSIYLKQQVFTDVHLTIKIMHIFTVLQSFLVSFVICLFHSPHPTPFSDNHGPLSLPLYCICWILNKWNHIAYTHLSLSVSFLFFFLVCLLSCRIITLRFVHAAVYQCFLPFFYWVIFFSRKVILGMIRELHKILLKFTWQNRHRRII